MRNNEKMKSKITVIVATIFIPRLLFREIINKKTTPTMGKNRTILSKGIPGSIYPPYR